MKNGFSGNGNGSNGHSSSNGHGKGHLKEDIIDRLFWRDEILQIMYWFQGEGFGDEVTATDLNRFLASDAPDLAPYLDEMATDGWLTQLENGRYRLTPQGLKEGGRRFADAFEEMTKPGHGECSADCDCQGDPALCKHHNH